MQIPSSTILHVFHGSHCCRKYLVNVPKDFICSLPVQLMIISWRSHTSGPSWGFVLKFLRSKAYLNTLLWAIAKTLFKRTEQTQGIQRL